MASYTDTEYIRNALIMGQEYVVYVQQLGLGTMEGPVIFRPSGSTFMVEAPFQYLQVRIALHDEVAFYCREIENCVFNEYEADKLIELIVSIQVALRSYIEGYMTKRNLRQNIGKVDIGQLSKFINATLHKDYV
jgi:NAD-dependent oxidoreductase involved in siderophore biosynthesis